MANVLEPNEAQPKPAAAQDTGGAPPQERRGESIAPRDTRVIERVEKAEKTLKDAIEEAKQALRELIEKESEKEEQKQASAEEKLNKAQQQLDQAIKKVADDVAQSVRASIAEIIRSVEAVVRALVGGIPDRLTQILQHVDQVNRNVLVTSDNLSAVAAGFRQFQADMAEVKGHLIGSLNAANRAAMMANEIVGAKAEIINSVRGASAETARRFADVVELLRRLHERLSVLRDIESASRTLTSEIGKLSELRRITDELVKAFAKSSGDMQKDIRELRVSTIDYVMRIDQKQHDLLRELAAINAGLTDLRNQVNTLANIVDAIRKQI